ncbi:MAG: DNA translocase FtsK [Candidatus Krumholzibacteriota bacterium]|nr:DNA translocase FtsK [Candidatus Krumholzibacteriota bacterium]
MKTRRHALRGLLFLFLAVLLSVSIATHDPTDLPRWEWDRHLLAAENAFGFVGAILAKALVDVLGALAPWLLAPACLLAAWADLTARRRRGLLIGWTAAGLLALLWAGSPWLGGPAAARAGWLGVLLAEGLLSFTGRTGSQVLLGFLTLAGLFAVLPGAWLPGLRRAGLVAILALPRAAWWLLRGAGLLAVGAGHGLAALVRAANRGAAGMRWRLADWQAARRAAREAASAARGEAAIYAARAEAAAPSVVAAPPPAGDLEAPAMTAAAAAGTAASVRATAARPQRRPAPVGRRGDYVLPDSSLLEPPGPVDRQADRRALEERARILVDKLASFNVNGRVSAMSQGPVVTTYEFEPDSGVKVNQIVSRREDLALALRSKELRLVAPIPGKAAVGIEVPNPRPHLIRLREVLEADSAAGRGGELALALGVDVDGRATWTDLAEMPHLLVAGATGTGKSVCINSLLVSLLLVHTPETLRLFLVDPKMLELSIYNDIPHLLHPVITDNRMALQALNWLVGEMERRYLLLKPAGVRSLEEYNARVRDGQITDAAGEAVTATLPFLVCVVEEFADLMMTLGRDVQTPIIRLAQMARAVGIHLILATQRPSVDIIDGVIKANFPSRIAFKVFSRFDSKTILDGVGAETLIGRGDMLFKHGRRPFPQRLHGAFVGTEEVERVVAHWREQAAPEPPLALERQQGAGPDFGAEDELYEDARRIVVLQGFGSTTMLQRRLRVGYTRASRLMDMLEEAGIVGPHTGSKAREVLVGPEALADAGDGDGL